ncbi:sulfotransferase family 2 domain-containing protein [Lewinella sp. 4G2]|uniref:sulfotransferase family 2 domain-containing protein n=1 Tax=Lewinella sp. 4G2 TaxID=1803372 RepID=UPI0007B4945F|nr:sulfotransferase family 2 domain-containing protein [Lewinella sp. 4G2]OAV44839.1 hypothetical protein A3850_010205 [Lewinella sp. 4G2]
MIVSHAHRTCFFAVPRTASKAISKAMIEHLDGEEIKPMHLSYAEFMKAANRSVRNYFTFATVRNPMDSVVSAYFKKKSDHNGRFSRGTFKSGRPIAPRAMAEYRFIVENDADFATYFAEFHRGEYQVPRHQETLAKVDHVLRYETLTEDYNQLCNQRGWPAHNIPVFNRTEGKEKDFLSYYTPAIRGQAKAYFGRIFTEWGYSFPANW